MCFFICALCVWNKNTELAEDPKVFGHSLFDAHVSCIINIIYILQRINKLMINDIFRIEKMTDEN